MCVCVFACVRACVCACMCACMCAAIPEAWLMVCSGVVRRRNCLATARPITAISVYMACAPTRQRDMLVFPKALITRSSQPCKFTLSRSLSLSHTNDTGPIQAYSMGENNATAAQIKQPNINCHFPRSASDTALRTHIKLSYHTNTHAYTLTHIHTRTYTFTRTHTCSSLMRIIKPLRSLNLSSFWKTF